MSANPPTVTASRVVVLEGVAMTARLGRGPWLERRPKGGKSYYRTSWEVIELDGAVKRRSKSLGYFRDDEQAWDAIEALFEELGVVLDPATDETEEAGKHRGVRRGQVLKPQIARIRQEARVRYSRLQDELARARELLASQGLHPGQQPAPPVGLAALPEGTALLAVLPDGRCVRVPFESLVALGVAEATPVKKPEEASTPPLQAGNGHSVHSWLQSQKLRRHIERSYERSAGKRFAQIRQLVGGLPDLPLPDLATRHVHEYQVLRREHGNQGRGCASTTVKVELETLKIALRYAQECGVVTEVIEWKPPRWRHGSRARIAWSLAEYARALMVATPPKQDGVTRGRPPLPFSRDIGDQIVLGVEALLRPGETLHLRWENVELDRDPVRFHVVSLPQWGWWVKGDDGKRGRDRWIPASPLLADRLRKRWQQMGRPASGWLFPGRDDESKPRGTFRGALDRVCEQAGVRRITCHELRHTGATIGVHHRGYNATDLMALGGWASPVIPLRVYVRPCAEAAARKMREAAPITERPPPGIDRATWVALHPCRGRKE